MVESESSSSDDENPVEPAPTPTGVQKNFKKWKNVPNFGQLCGPFVPTKMFSRFDSHGHTTRSFLELNKNVGLLIDLSKEIDPYDSNFDHAIEYVKHPAVSKEIPAEDYVATFLEIVDKYRENHPDRAIATHCHYGFNRTGFMICSYLCSHENMSPLDAIARFAKARPPGIKHEHFRRELIKRFGAPHGQFPEPFDAEAEERARLEKQKKKDKKRRSRKKMKLTNSGDSAPTALASAPNSPKRIRSRSQQHQQQQNGVIEDDEDAAHQIGKPSESITSSSVSSSLLSKEDEDEKLTNGVVASSSSSSSLTPLLSSMPMPSSSPSSKNNYSLPSNNSNAGSSSPLSLPSPPSASPSPSSSTSPPTGVTVPSSPAPPTSSHTSPSPAVS